MSTAPDFDTTFDTDDQGRTQRVVTRLSRPADAVPSDGQEPVGAPAAGTPQVTELPGPEQSSAPVEPAAAPAAPPTSAAPVQAVPTASAPADEAPAATDATTPVAPAAEAPAQPAPQAPTLRENPLDLPPSTRPEEPLSPLAATLAGMPRVDASSGTPVVVPVAPAEPPAAPSGDGSPAGGPGAGQPAPAAPFTFPPVGAQGPTSAPSAPQVRPEWHYSGPRMTAVVWGLIVAVVGAIILALSTGMVIDLGLAAIGVLCVAGMILLIGAAVSGRAKARRSRRGH